MDFQVTLHFLAIRASRFTAITRSGGCPFLGGGALVGNAPSGLAVKRITGNDFLLHQFAPYTLCKSSSPGAQLVSGVSFSTTPGCCFLPASPSRLPSSPLCRHHRRIQCPTTKSAALHDTPTQSLRHAFIHSTPIQPSQSLKKVLLASCFHTALPCLFFVPTARPAPAVCRQLHLWSSCCFNCSSPLVAVGIQADTFLSCNYISRATRELVPSTPARHVTLHPRAGQHRACFLRKPW
jgi:hypothetical protein